MRTRLSWPFGRGLIATRHAAAALCCGAVLWHAAPMAKEAAAKPLDVVATIKPVHSLVAAVMEGVGEPRLLIDGVHSPHHYALKPSEAQAIHGADLLVRMSPNIETFTQKLMAVLPEVTSVLTLDSVDGLTRLSARGTHVDSHQEHNTRHANAEEGAKVQELFDAHVWLDPQNGQRMLQTIAAKLAERAPQHAERFQRNADAASKRLAALETDLRQKLKPITGRPFIVFHDAFQYFEHRFGLRNLGAISQHPEVPPSGKQIAQMRAIIRTKNIACVFSDPQFDTRRLQSITEGTKAQIEILDPLGGTLEKGPAAYETLLRNLSDSLATCLSRR